MSLRVPVAEDQTHKASAKVYTSGCSFVTLGRHKLPLTSEKLATIMESKGDINPGTDTTVAETQPIANQVT